MTLSTSPSYHRRKSRKSKRRSKSRKRHWLSNDDRLSRGEQPLPRSESPIHRDSGAYERDKLPSASKADCSGLNNLNSGRRGAKQSVASRPVSKRMNTGPLPAGPQNQQITSPTSTASGSRTSDFAQDVRRIIDLFSDRSLYYALHDAADKKYRERHREMERCQSSRFSSAIDILEYETKAADTERRKVAQRLFAVDNRLVKATTSSIHKWSATLDNKILAAVKGAQGHPTAPASETADLCMFDIEEKLAWLRDMIEPSVAKRVAQEAEEFKSTIVAGYDSRIEELQLRVDQEMAARSAAEQKLENFATRLESMEAAMEKLTVTGGTATQENKALRENITGLEARLTQLDDVTDSSTAKLSSHSDFLAELLERVSEWNADAVNTKRVKEWAVSKTTNLSDCSTACQSMYKSLAIALESLTPLRSEFDNIVENMPPDSLSEDHVLKLVDQQASCVEERLQKSLKTIASGLAPLIDEEREGREKLESRLTTVANDVAESAVSLSDASIAIQDLQGRLKDLQVKGFRHNGATADRLSQHTKTMQEFASHIEATRQDTMRGFSDLAMQLQGVTAWQNHFTTDGLYHSIVAHLDEVLVQKYVAGIRSLAARVEAIERRMDGNTKKGKLASGPIDMAHPG